MLSLRASKLGGCVRSYILDLRNNAEWVLSSRQKLYFAVGKTLEPIIMKHAGYSPSMLFDDLFEIRWSLGPGLEITGHPDSADDNYVIECKTMRTGPYKRMIKYGLEVAFPQYLVQGAIYCKAMYRSGVKYLCLDKDASHIQQLIVPWVTLEPYWDKAVDNARKIARWLDKKRLPEKDPELPYAYCLEGFCEHRECRHHMVNRRRVPITDIKVEAWNGEF